MAAFIFDRHLPNFKSDDTYDTKLRAQRPFSLLQRRVLWSTFFINVTTAVHSTSISFIWKLTFTWSMKSSISLICEVQCTPFRRLILVCYNLTFMHTKLLCYICRFIKNQYEWKRLPRVVLPTIGFEIVGGIQKSFFFFIHSTVSEMIV